MTACKHFIIGIQQINFATEPAKRLQQVLLAYALKDLNTEEQSQQELLSQLPETIEGNPIANKQLALVKEKIGSQIKSIQSRIGNIRKEASQLGIDLDAEIELDDVFIEIFADNFRNIPHLDETLSDAPPEIKAIQTKLYSVVLSKLDQKEQEQQLASLSTANIQDMVNQALLTYQTSKEPALKTKSQHLIQMGIFELIHRESIKLTEARHPDYLAFTRKLHHLLPEVGNSDVIDELSEYQNSDGQTISKLLFAVSEALHLQHHPWDSDEQIESAKEIRALFHKLRFGQSDRREYIEKRKANMQRDLLWARTIQDTELFTISDESEREFHKLEELRILNHDRKFKIHSEVKNRVFPKQKLEMAFREAFRQRKDAKLPLGIKSNPLVQGTKAYTQVLKILEDAFQAEIEKPVITVGQDGKIKAAFFYLDTPIQTILNAILDGGGFGRSPESIARTAFDLEAIKRSIVTHSFEGETLAEIESQIQFPEDETIKHSFTEALNNVKQSVPSRTISDLQLGLSEELLLRKLLELHRFYSYSPPSPESLTTIFSELERAPMDALKLSDLEQTVSQHFIILAEKNEEDVPLEVRSIVRKAKTMLMSNAERIRKIETFHAAFESTAATNSMLKALFRDEYQAMSQTLKLSAEEIVEMNQDMDAMIDEFLLLHERTKGGQPVLSKPEEEAYFSVVKQIAEEIKPKSLADYQFKILHSSHGRQEVKLTSLTGETRQVLIDIGRTKLPYSLIKPPGASELIFSYGGSRGIIAPFEGFATTHGSLKHRKRLFTHSRLLGVGQYGSVKEVEGLLTGLNRVIKEGYALTTDATPAFENQLRENLRSRPITSREDPLYRIESDILQTLSSAEQNSRDSFSGGTQYWLKEKEKKTKTLRQYQILTARAKGDTLADTASQAFNRYSKTDLAYHNPVIRPDYHNLSTLENRLALSEALVHEAEQFHALGFAHNDIKPENFLYKRDANGHYSVRFIDWATGGFERAVDPAVIPQEVATDHQLEIIFKELFGTDLTYTLGEHQCSDPQGRFVRYNPDTKGFSFGVNPTLEILHGARNGTLPYISPTVLGEERNKTGLPTGERDSTLNTRFTSNDPTMDNWALTAMTFGICNRQAYFALVRGRVLSDYVVPQVLDIADQDPQGLTIVDVEKFNQLFAVDEITAEDLATGQAYTQTDGVMYIPGNPREGEPLHLYRHLKALRAQCTQKKTPTAAEQEIIDRIDEILSTVHQAVANGKGLSKEALQEQFKKATSCIEQFQQLHNEDYLASLNQEALLNSILAKYKDKPAPSANDLLQKTTSGVSELDILFTYSKSAAQQQESLAILNNAFTSNDLENLCFNEDAPYSHLLKTGIALNQRIILQGVLSKVDADNASFYEHVHDQGLLHFSLQQGQTEVFSALIEALQKAGAEDKTIFDLLTQEYGPGQDQLPTQKHIQWSNDTFHIVIRNHNLKQLQLILDRLPEEPGYEPILLKALHQAALLSHQDCYQMLLERYNARYPDNIITPETIVATTYPPDDSSPYHLFLRDETTLGSIDWSALEANTELAKSFLLHTPANTTAFPLLITTQFSNYTGMEKLLTLGDKAGLIEEEWQALFLQTDADGKNILNHCLEQGQLQELPSILDAIRQRCGEKSTNILITLLSNPNPLNPLQNFLATEEVTTVQYRIVSELLDAISKDYTKASKPEQQARIIALLVNKVWLFEQADTNPEELRTLLQNNALSIPYKQLLFKQLTEKAPERSAAKDYFKHLLAEVSPQVSEIQERKVNLELPAILGEVTKQERGALNDLIDELTRNSGIASAVKVATLELNAKIRDIETRIAEEGRKLATTTSALHTQIARAEASETQQHSIQAELETAQTELQRLKAEALSLTTAHTAEVERLQTQIQQVSGQNEADKAELTAQLDALNAAHKIAQDAIATQLQEARDQVGGLEEKLESQAAQLAQSQHEARALSQELESLKPQYEELKTRLEQQTELSSTEQQRLSDLLEQQTRAAQEATQKTSELETRLNTTRRENQALQERTKILETENAGLLTKVGGLEENLIRIRAELEETKTNLETQIARAEASETQQHSIQAELETAQTELQRLKAEALSLTTAHTAEVERLQTQIQQVSGQNEADKAELTAQLDALNAAHKIAQDAITAQLQEARDQVGGLEEKLESQAAQLAQSQHEARALSQELESLKPQYEELKTRLEQQTELSSTEQQRLSDLLEQQTRAAQEATQKTSELETRLNTTRRENQALQERTKILETENAGLLTKVGGLEENLIRIRAELEETKTNLETQIARAEASETQQHSIQAELETAQTELQRLKAEALSLTTAHTAEVERLQTQIQQVSGQNEADKAELTAQLDALNAAHKIAQDAITAQLQEARDQVGGLEEKLESQAAQLAQSQHEARALSQELESLKPQYEELKTRLEQQTELSSTEQQRLSDLLEQQTRAAQEATQKTSELETRLNTTQRENQALQERTRALEGENAALLAEIDELKNILATASEDIRVKSRQSDLLSEKIYQILLANLKARISKSERLLEKIQHDGVEITQDRIDKHQSEVDLISKQWTNRQPTPEQQEAFDRLILRWNEIRTELESVLQQKTETVSPPPSPMQSIISESTSRIQSNSPELEEEQQYVTSPQISSSDSTPPSSPRENQNISTSEHALPHQDSESPASTHKIFALLNRNGNALQSRSNKDLFEEIEGEQVIRINFPDATILTEKEAREFLGTGTEVKSPANHTYTLGMKDGKPWASLAKKEVAIKEDESEEQSRQRLAVTVMNMVENILSKGTVINIKTNDPFIAKVADQYINHLKQIGISISKYTLSGVELDENHKSFKDENHKSFKEAKQIFDRLKPKYSRDVLESNAPWYKEAQTYREKLQTRNTQEETQSTSNSPIRR